MEGVHSGIPAAQARPMAPPAGQRPLQRGTHIVVNRGGDAGRFGLSERSVCSQEALQRQRPDGVGTAGTWHSTGEWAAGTRLRVLVLQLTLRYMDSIDLTFK